MRQIFLIGAILFSGLMMAQNRLRLFSASSRIVCKNGGTWSQVFKGQSLRQTDVLLIPANSVVEISDMKTSLVYKYKTERQENIRVADLVRKVMNEDNSWLKKMFKTMFARKSKVCYNPVGATRLSSSADVERELCAFFKTAYLNSHGRSKAIVLKRMNHDEGFTFKIENNSSEGYFFNVVKVGVDGVANVCYNLFDVNVDGDPLEASLYIGPYESLDMSRFAFVNDGTSKYYVIASKTQFSSKLLDEYFSKDTASGLNYDKEKFFVGISE